MDELWRYVALALALAVVLFGLRDLSAALQNLRQGLKDEREARL